MLATANAECFGSWSCEYQNVWFCLSLDPASRAELVVASSYVAVVPKLMLVPVHVGQTTCLYVPVASDSSIFHYYVYRPPTSMMFG